MQSIEKPRKRWLRWIGIVSVVLLLCFGLSYYFLVFLPKARIESRVAEIRDRGEPMYHEDIKWIYPPIHSEDDCSEIVSNAAQIFSEGNKRWEDEKGAYAQIPIIGHNASPISDYLRGGRVSLIENDLHKIEELLQEKQEGFDLVEQASAKGFHIYYEIQKDIDPQMPYMTEIPELSNTKTVIDFLELRCFFNLKRSNIDAVIHDIKIINQINNRLKEVPDSLSYTLSYHRSRNILFVISDLLSNHQLSLSQLDALEPDKNIDDYMIIIRYLIYIERKMYYQVYLYILNKFPIPIEITDQYYVYQTDSTQQIMDVLDFYEFYLSLDYSKNYKSLIDQIEQYIKEFDSKEKREGFLVPLVTFSIDISEFSDWTIACIHGDIVRNRILRIALAWKRFYLIEQRYPKDLEELTSRYPNLKIDDMYLPQPLKYIEDDAQLLIYSVGRDLNDDGGSIEFFKDRPPGYPDIGIRIKK